MSYELTEEQKNILNTVYDNSHIIKLNATAGSGKTSTLIELVKEIRKNDKDSKILYTVFNRSMFEESKKKFDSLGLNVECQTTHGFALKRFSALKKGEIDVIPALDFNTFIELKNSNKYNKSWIRFKTINEIFNAYCLTYDDMDTFIKNIYIKGKYDIQCKISITERDFFKDLYEYMIENNLYTHGMYLKEYACNGKDKITSYKYVLLDEAQDCNLHFYRILKRMQYDKLYAVGDTAQNIYGFTRTVNIFDKLDGVTMPLSKSFRINDYGCDIANRVLAYHYNNFKYGDIQNYFNRTEIEDKSKKTILFRLNATLFEYAVDLISKVDNIKVHFMDSNSKGNTDGFESCFNDMLYFYYQLLKSYNEKTAEEFKATFKFVPAKLVDNYIKICQKENKSLYHYLCRNKTVLPLDYIKYFNFFLLNEMDIINVVNKVKHSEDCVNPDKEYFLSTAHRYKGLEAENVKIAPDDWSLNSDAECNLCYVAVTRATKQLDARPIEALLEK